MSQDSNLLLDDRSPKQRTSSKQAVTQQVVEARFSMKPGIRKVIIGILGYNWLTVLLTVTTDMWFVFADFTGLNVLNQALGTISFLSAPLGILWIKILQDADTKG